MSNYITSGNGASSPGYLVMMRHGQTEWSVTGQHTGRTDLPLTDEGRAQAVAGGERVREMYPQGFVPERIWVSPLRRARQTAQLAGFGEFKVVDELAEWDYGRAEGRTREQVSEALGRRWELWADGPQVLGADMDGDWEAELASGERVAVHNGIGETVKQVAQRAERVVERADQAIRSGDDVLLVAHAHVLRLVATQWLGLEPAQARLLRFDTAHCSSLGYYKNDRVIEHWNL